MPPLNWDEDVRPVLVAISKALDASDDYFAGTDSRAIAEELGRDEADLATIAAVQSLKDTSYITIGMEAMGTSSVEMVKLTEKGLQEVAGWPMAPGSDFGARFIEELERRIAEAPEGPERTRLERMKVAALDVGKAVITGVLTELATGG